MNQSHPMTRLEVVNVETLEVTKAVYLAGHNALEIQQMSDSLLRNLNTFQFFVRATPIAAPVVAADPIRHALEVMVERFGPCESEYIFSKRLAIQNAREALAAAPVATPGA